MAQMTGNQRQTGVATTSKNNTVQSQLSSGGGNQKPKGILGTRKERLSYSPNPSSKNQRGGETSPLCLLSSHTSTATNPNNAQVNLSLNLGALGNSTNQPRSSQSQQHGGASRSNKYTRVTSAVGKANSSSLNNKKKHQRSTSGSNSKNSSQINTPLNIVAANYAAFTSKNSFIVKRLSGGSKSQGTSSVLQQISKQSQTQGVVGSSLLQVTAQQAQTILTRTLDKDFDSKQLKVGAHRRDNSTGKESIDKYIISSANSTTQGVRKPNNTTTILKNTITTSKSSHRNNQSSSQTRKSKAISNQQVNPANTTTGGILQTSANKLASYNHQSNHLGNNSSTNSSAQKNTKMKKKQHYHTTTTSSTSGAQPILNTANLVQAAAQVAAQVGLISQSSSTTNALKNSAQIAAALGSKKQSHQVQQPRNVNGIIMIEGAAASHPNNSTGPNSRPLNSNHSIGLTPATAGSLPQKKVNNFMIDAAAYQSNPAPPHSSQSMAGIKLVGGKNPQVKVSQHHKTHSSGAVTTKHSNTKNPSMAAQGPGGTSWKFVERRLSAKVLQGGSSDAGGGPSIRKAQGSSKGSIQYENLMLQQLLKQQQKMDSASVGAGANGAFKKNLSVISIDQQQQQHPPGNAVPQQLVAPPHMMLNISYNMNNNIDANSAAQFVFHQQPPPPAQPAQDPISSLHHHLAQHHPLTNQQQQQIRTIIGLATAATGNAELGGGQQSTTTTNDNHHHSHLVDSAAALAAAYKTQVDLKKKANNPYHTNASSSLLGDGGGLMMTYENSIAQQQKDIKYRGGEQSFDQIKRKRRSVNSGAHARSKQLSSNSGRRAGIAVAQSNKSASQQPGGNNPHSRSNSSKRNANPKIGQQQLRGESSRGLLQGQPAVTSSQSNNSIQHHLNKKQAQKKSLEQAKLKVKNTYTAANPPDLQNQRAISGQLGASTAPNINVASSGFSNASSFISDNDKYLFSKLDEALQRDLKDKSSSQRVAICSKVWSEIIRRQEPVIFNLLTQIKQNYEHHIKHQGKQLSQQQKELAEELEKERGERERDREEVAKLKEEVAQLQTSTQQKDESINAMKKQILQYRREIIELSSTKKYSHHNSKSDGRRVPRLDLSKLHRDSEDGAPGNDDSCASIQDNNAMGEEEKNVTYQQYLKFLENEDRFDEYGNPLNGQGGGPNNGGLPMGADQLAEESQESIIRQEELKQRKNKIIQLLNGDISEDGGGQGDQEYGEEEEEAMEEEDGVEVDFHHQLQQQQQLQQLTSEDFDEYHIVTQNNNRQQVTSNDDDDSGAEMQQFHHEHKEIDLVQAAAKAAKARESGAKYQMVKGGGQVKNKGGAYMVDDCLVVEDLAGDSYEEGQEGLPNQHFIIDEDDQMLEEIEGLASDPEVVGILQSVNNKHKVKQVSNTRGDDHELQRHHRSKSLS